MVHPLIATPLLLCSAVLTGALIEWSWWAVVPSLLCHILTILWTTYQAEQSQQQMRVRHSYALSALLVVSEIACIVCAYYFQITTRTLALMHLSLILPHCSLLEMDFGEEEQKRSSKWLVVVFLPLSILAAVSIGVVYNLSGWAAIPLCTLLQYSLYYSECGIRHAHTLTHPRRFSIVLFIVLVFMISASFTTHFLYPLLCPTTVVAAYTITCLIYIVEKQIDGTISARLRVFRALHLLLAICLGVAWAVRIGEWFFALLGLLDLCTFAISWTLCEQHIQNFNPNQPAPVDNRSRFLVLIFISILALQICCCFGFYFAVFNFPYTIPLFLTTQSILHLFQTHISYQIKDTLKQFEEKNELTCGIVCGTFLSLVLWYAYLFHAQDPLWQPVLNGYIWFGLSLLDLACNSMTVDELTYLRNEAAAIEAENLMRWLNRVPEAA